MKYSFVGARLGVVAISTILVASCGGGTVDSGGAFDVTTGDVAGPYTACAAGARESRGLVLY